MASVAAIVMSWLSLIDWSWRTALRLSAINQGGPLPQLNRVSAPRMGLEFGHRIGQKDRVARTEKGCRDNDLRHREQ
jgi:hypothetical protein